MNEALRRLLIRQSELVEKINTTPQGRNAQY